MIAYQHIAFPEMEGLPIMLITPDRQQSTIINFKQAKEIILGALLRGEAVWLSDCRAGLNIISFADKKAVLEVERKLKALEKAAHS